MHENYITVTTVLVAVILFGWLLAHIATKGFAYVFGSISIRFWALSCAWHAFRVTFRKEHQSALVALQEQQTQRQNELRASA